MLTRRLVLALIAASAAFPALADKVFVDESGFAIRGTDPVAYFEEGRPVAGDPGLAAEWQGATWLFASAANRDAFAANPERYAPQYGGYCAYAVAQGALATIDPEAWTIHEGRLYLNFSPTVRIVWREDVPGNISKADANWPALR
jgi:YHS domain-containing protein